MSTTSHKVPKSTAPAGAKGKTKHDAKSKVIGHHGGSAEPTGQAMDAEDYAELTHGKKPSPTEERREAKQGM